MKNKDKIISIILGILSIILSPFIGLFLGVAAIAVSRKYVPNDDDSLWQNGTPISNFFNRGNRNYNPNQNFNPNQNSYPQQNFNPNGGYPQQNFNPNIYPIYEKTPPNELKHKHKEEKIAIIIILYIFVSLFLLRIPSVAVNLVVFASMVIIPCMILAFHIEKSYYKKNNITKKKLKHKITLGAVLGSIGVVISIPVSVALLLIGMPKVVGYNVNPILEVTNKNADTLRSVAQEVCDEYEAKGISISMGILLYSEQEEFDHNDQIFVNFESENGTSKITPEELIGVISDRCDFEKIGDNPGVTDWGVYITDGEVLSSVYLFKVDEKYSTLNGGNYAGCSPNHLTKDTLPWTADTRRDWVNKRSLTRDATPDDYEPPEVLFTTIPD